MNEIPFADPTPYVGLPPKRKFTDREWFQALDQFARVFAIRPGERVLMLTDPLLDARVVDAVTGLARARGATLTQYMAPHTSLPSVPDEVKPIIEQAAFIVSTWFCSIADPFNVAMRKRGQRWVKIEGVLYPQWAIGFQQPFAERIAFLFQDKHVRQIKGESQEAKILREMCLGSRLIEGGGCGFNPKAPRYTVYPAGSNSPGALHFGVDLAKPSDYIRRVMPNWEEPPVHQDLIAFDMTVTAGGEPIIDNGFLVALRDPAVVEMAKRYGDPVELLEAGP